MYDAHFSVAEAMSIGATLGIDWQKVDLEEFRLGLEVELEHGTRDPTTDVTGDDPIRTGKLALAHLKQIPDYYTRLAVLEAAADTFWRSNTVLSRGFVGDDCC